MSRHSEQYQTTSKSIRHILGRIESSLTEVITTLYYSKKSAETIDNPPLAKAIEEASQKALLAAQIANAALDELSRRKAPDETA